MYARLNNYDITNTDNESTKQLCIHECVQAVHDRSGVFYFV